MNETKPMPMRVTLREGDVFEFVVPDGRFAYGIILKRGALKNGETPYIALFRSLYNNRPAVDELLRDDVAFAGWSMDTLVYHGRWTIVARDVPQPRVPFPNFKVTIGGEVWTTDVDGQAIDRATLSERDLLDFKWSRSPAGFQDAFGAIHGFGEWKSDYEKLTPAYADERVTRPPTFKDTVRKTVRGLTPFKP